MINPEIVKQARRIYIAARQFHLAADALSANVAASNMQLVIPMFATIAFTMELYLKCLVFLDTGRDPPWKHDYVTLFSLLKHETQDFLRFRVIGGGVVELNVDAPPRKLDGEELRVKATEMFNNILERSKDSFRNIRYIHQGYEANWDAAPIMEAVIEAIHTRHPDWIKS